MVAMDVSAGRIVAGLDRVGDFDQLAAAASGSA